MRECSKGVFLSVAAVTAAVVASAAVAAAVVFFAVMVVVVIAFCGRVIVESACCEAFHSLVSITLDAAEQLYARLSQRHLCAAANSSADEHVCAESGKKTCKSAVTAAVGGNNFGGDYLAILHGVELKLLGVTKMLKNLSIFVSYCNFHYNYPFYIVIVSPQER